MRRVTVLPALLLVTAGLGLTAPPAQAAGELWNATGIISFGCADESQEISYDVSGLTGTGYIAHTRAYVDGLLYMNEDAGEMENESGGDWGIYESDTYDVGSLTGTWPMPPGKRVTILLELEKPKGAVVSSWKLSVDGCDTGNIVYNGPSAADADDDLVATPTDVCPEVAATRANGCPLVARTVTLKYRKGQQKFVGRIASPAFELRQRKNVVVYKLRPGKDKKIGSSKSGLTSHFSVRRAAGPGRYYAVVRAGLVPDVGEVAETRSRVLRLR